jgi:Flp pilus assembly protein TadD
MNRRFVSPLRIPRKQAIAHCLIVLITSAVGGCQSRWRESPYETSKRVERLRNSQTAQRLNDEGLKAVDAGELHEAEAAFRRALEADLFYGPAHNNLGLVHMKNEKLYDAAWEFEYAAKLMPHSAEPRNNLGLVMEKAGRLDDAIDAYEQALTIDTENPEIMGHLARAYIRQNQTPNRADPLLKKLTHQHPNHQWGQWAKSKLIAGE